MARYDEDLHENLFFQTLIGKYGSLFKEAAEHRWLVCVPRCDAVSRLKLDRKDFENHILRPFKPESSENTFISLNNKVAMIEGDMITVGMGYKEPRTVKILFDESFFNSREESYQVFCLEQPMEGAMGEDIMISLKNLDDCNKFLWGEPGGEKVRRSVDRLIEIFIVERGTPMRALMDTTLAVYTRAVQEVFKIRKFQAAMQKNFCKLAVETYIMAGLHRKIFKEVCFTVAQKFRALRLALQLTSRHLEHLDPVTRKFMDTTLNKITRNLSDSSPQSLGIKSQFRLLLPKARAILSQLNQFTTPLEKLYCFSHTISALTTGSPDTTMEAVTADELLPILVYLVIVTDVPNWNGNLTYINRFHFSNISFEEFTYYLTSFEAAVEYVRSEHMQQSTKALSHIGQVSVQRLRSNSGVDEETRQFFTLVTEGNVQQVRSMLEKAELEKSSLKSRLCHPLCNCRKCSVLLDKQLDDSDHASVFLRDSDGRTGLHHAALLGHNELVQLLMEHGAIVMATDHNSSTPLHLACLKGHQKCTLLLLGEGSNINAIDNHGNTPLHQACSNGHEECVKSLLFHTTHCDVNLANDQGDTPLHTAARWGYGVIVSELLRMGASPQLQNRRREIAYQCAQNRKVQELLSEAQIRHTQQKATNETDGGMSVGVVTDGESPVVIRSNKRMSKRMSMRESMSEGDRQLKKLFRAIQDGDTNLVRFIFGWEETNSPISPTDLCHPLCQCDRCSKLRKSLSTSILSINCTDPFGHTPLHKACLVGEREMVELFIRHGALLDSRTKDNDQTPLHLACQYNQKDVVMRLLEYRAQIDVQDSLGNTPLHLACNNGHMETATLLLMHGADVTICNNRLDTPLHNAARWNHPSLVSELLLYGARYTATNNDNKTPLDLTSDDQVRELIWKASKGFLAVGSYSPLIRRSGSTSSQKEASPLSVSTSVEVGATASGKGNGLVASSSPSSSGERGKEMSPPTPGVSSVDTGGLRGSGIATSSGRGKSPPGEKIGSEVGTGGLRGSGIATSSGRGKEMSPWGEKIGSEVGTGGFRGSAQIADVSSGRGKEMSPSEGTEGLRGSGFVPAVLGESGLVADVSLLGVSESSGVESRDVTPGSCERDVTPGSCEQEVDDIDISDYDILEDDLVEHRPLGNQHGVESKGQSSEVVASESSHMKEEGLEDSHPEAGAQVKSTPESREPKTDEKLISLLKAIEEFDRSTLNRRRNTVDRSIPILPPPLQSPPPLQFPPPLDTSSPPLQSPPPLGMSPDMSSSPLQSPFPLGMSPPPPGMSSSPLDMFLPPHPMGSSPHLMGSPPGQLGTSPYSPTYFPPPVDEEMQTVGRGVGGRDQEVTTPTVPED